MSHILGKFGAWKKSFLGPVLFSLIGKITCGITSPALSTKTMSPIFKSFFSISLKLCKGFETSAPPITTGLSSAKGNFSCSPHLRVYIQ